MPMAILGTSAHHSSMPVAPVTGIIWLTMWLQVYVEQQYSYKPLKFNKTEILKNNNNKKSQKEERNKESFIRWRI